MKRTKGKTKYKNLSYEFLYNEHWIKNKSLKQIARENNIPEGSICYLFKMFGVKKRPNKEANKLHFRKNIDKNELIDLYWNKGYDFKKLAEHFNCSMSVISKRFREYNIPKRKRVPWNKGLTAKEDERVRKSCEIAHRALKEKYEKGEWQPWNKGLNKYTSKKVAELSKKLGEIRKEIFKGENNPFYGKRHKPETIRHLSLIRGGTGIPYEKTGYGPEFNDKLKEEIRKRDNYTCQLCGITEEEHIIIYGRRLDVHHIDYNKKNNKKDNLIALCMACHRRTNINRDYWREYFNNLKIKW